MNPQAQITLQEVQKLCEEIELMKSLLPTTSGFVVGFTFVTNSSNSNILNCLSSFTSKSPQASWILDSGATDHMTPVCQFFVSFTPCINIKRVQTADGTILRVAGIGSINIKPLGTLHYVLHVPRLLVNPE